MKIDDNFILFITCPFIFFSLNVIFSSIHLSIFPLFNLSLFFNIFFGFYYFFNTSFFIAYLSCVFLSFIWIMSFLFYIIIEKSIIFSIYTIIVFSLILIKFVKIDKKIILFIPMIINFFFFSYNILQDNNYNNYNLQNFV